MISNDKYAKAYTEVLGIISHFPQEEIDRIPKEKIDFYKENMDKNYEFKINPEIDLSEQNVSREANALIIMLYKDYFATEEQIKAIDQKLMENEKKLKKKKEINIILMIYLKKYKQTIKKMKIILIMTQKILKV